MRILTNNQQGIIGESCSEPTSGKTQDTREQSSQTLTYIDRLSFIYRLWPSNFKTMLVFDLWFWYNYGRSNHRQSTAVLRGLAPASAPPESATGAAESHWKHQSYWSVQTWTEILAGFSAWPTGAYLSPQAQQYCSWKRFFDSIWQPRAVASQIQP